MLFFKPVTITNYAQHLLHPVIKKNGTATCKWGGTEMQSILVKAT